MSRAGAGAAGRLRRGLGRGLELLLPPVCVLCRRGVGPGAPPLCGLCLARLPRLVPPWCGRCGATALRFGGEAAPCPECREWPAGLRAAAPFRMTGDAARLVHELKYRGWRRLATPMAAAMAPAARRLLRPTGPRREPSAGPPEPVLVPVPLSPARRRKRGFNQAALLAAELAGTTGWPVRNALRRRETGERQARLARGARVENVRDAFRAVRGAAHRPEVMARPLLVVDDVVTTGATAGACRRALSEAGFRCLGVVAFARRSEPLPGAFGEPAPG